MEILIKETESFIFYSDGNVYSKTLNRFLKKSISTGYEKIHIRNKSFKVSRIVAFHFIPNPNKLPQVNHIDGNKMNNNYWNLEWCTSSHNLKHAYALGLNNGNRRLKDWQVKAIRFFVLYKVYHRKTIAMDFNIALYTVCDIVKKRTLWICALKKTWAIPTNPGFKCIHTMY